MRVLSGQGSPVCDLLLLLEDEEELVHVLPVRALLRGERVVLHAHLLWPYDDVVLRLARLEAPHALVEVEEQPPARLARDLVLAALADAAGGGEIVVGGELLVDGGGALGGLREGLGEAGLEEEVGFPDAHWGRAYIDTHTQENSFFGGYTYSSRNVFKIEC